ncbi:MAG: TolC family outer membrane protein [Gammaproteobacteria bacterium AqS3]|nr:TolC family outer membrane protein [Gammaproteobacteria bacterium AqS3]
MLRRTLLLIAAWCMVQAAWGESIYAMYEKAVASDPMLKAAAANYRASRAGVYEAGSALMPQFTYIQSENESDITLVGTEGILNTTSEVREIQGSMALIDAAGWARVRSANRSRAAAFAAFDDKSQELILRFTRAYLEALTAVENVRVAEAEFRAVGRQSEVANSRYEAGLGNITERHEAKFQFDLVRVGLIRAQGEVELSRERLIEIVGEPVEVLLPISDSYHAQMPYPEKREDWVELALKNSPMLRQAGEEMKAAKANMAVAFSAHLPVVRAVASKREATQYNFGLRSDLETEDETLGLRLTIPLFAGGGNFARQRRASNQYQAARQNEIAVRRALVRQVRNAYQQVETALGNLRAMRQAVLSAQSAYQATEVGYETGTRNIVDVLNAQRLLYSAQRDTVSARNGFIISLFSLRYATGSLRPQHIRDLAVWQPGTPEAEAFPGRPGDSTRRRQMPPYQDDEDAESEDDAPQPEGDEEGGENEGRQEGQTVKA